VCFECGSEYVCVRAFGSAWRCLQAKGIGIRCYRLYVCLVCVCGKGGEREEEERGRGEGGGEEGRTKSRRGGELIRECARRTERQARRESRPAAQHAHTVHFIPHYTSTSLHCPTALLNQTAPHHITLLYLILHHATARYHIPPQRTTPRCRGHPC